MNAYDHKQVAAKARIAYDALYALSERSEFAEMYNASALHQTIDALERIIANAKRESERS